VMSVRAPTTITTTTTTTTTIMINTIMHRHWPWLARIQRRWPMPEEFPPRQARTKFGGHVGLQLLPRALRMGVHEGCV